MQLWRLLFLSQWVHDWDTAQVKKQKVITVYAKTKPVVHMKKCVDEAVELNRKGGGCNKRGTGQYCKQCMRKLKGETDEKGKKLTHPQKKKLCSYSSKGCPQPSCNEHICKGCWAEGYDRYPQRKWIIKRKQKRK